MNQDAGQTFGEILGLTDGPHPPLDPATVAPGSIDRRILTQDKVWVDRFGVVHQLATMGANYRRNVVAHLYLTCTGMWVGAALDEVLDHGVDYHQVNVSLGVAPIAEVGEHAWLESTALVRELRRATPDLASPQRLREWASAARAAGILGAAGERDVRLPQDPDRSWTADMDQAPEWTATGT